ncbi:endolytic transglycosylase MltG [Nigerium massiliense]|uniref:endolytic transglycosylase MltG n=1 Tax=Nigerium massiliense TaxID=1522317 RepID=UPI00069417FB|nr:endolytic transglycosylase MltG [Nigerium massiliense]
MAGHRYKDRDTLRDPETGEWDVKEVRRRAKGWIAVLIAFGVFAVAGIFVVTKISGVWADFRSAGDYTGTGVAPVEVTIPKGASVAQIGRVLAEARVVKEAKSFQQAAQMRPDDAKKLQAGRYKLKTELPAATALDMMLDPANSVRSQMQLREGLSIKDQLPVMAKASGVPLADLQKTVKEGSPAELGVPDWSRPGRGASDFEGFLYPDTYEVPDSPTAESVISTTTSEFNTVAKQLDFQAKAAQTPVKDPYKVLIVASLIEREVHRDADRAKVARVLYNRLDKGMRLQLDSTVHYATGKTDTVWTTKAERRTKSPYNTYLHTGLPPGPVTSPSKRAMEAALNPEAGDWLYFVVVNMDTGENAFATTNAEHNANRQKLQQWCAASDANRKKCA